MAKLLMIQGLPGSGKSTYARELEAEGWVRVNKDDIRERLSASGWVWSPEREADVLAERDWLITAALEAGKDVVSDDTNFSRKHKVVLEQIARRFGAEFQVKRFDTPIEECIRRDSLREGKARVGEEVIRKMAKQYGLLEAEGQPKFAPYVPPAHGTLAFICDLDGTIALPTHRSPYDGSKCDTDDVNEPVALVVRSICRDLPIEILYVSGRHEEHREKTLKWLREHKFPEGHLWMRKNGDYRTDWIIKGEIFDEHIRDHYNVKFAIDDRTQVVKFWRSLGLTVLQVAEGNF